MTSKELIEETLAPLRPILAEAGKALEIVSCEPPRVVVKLSGFCGGCECSGSYREGLMDLVFEKCPDIEEIEFVEEDAHAA
ncbi:NifU family protein [Candidatus Uhrbacteria bacterium]|nr:NifU family protein [Candidatus Uhrbacteria bacterium]